MDQSTPQFQPATTRPHEPANAPPEMPSRPDEPATAGPPAEPGAPIEAVGTHPLTGKSAARRLSAARRRALLRRRRRARWAILAVLLACVLLIRPTQSDWFAAAASARDAWRYDRALAFYRLAAQRDPADPRPYCFAGEVQALQQDLTAAVASYARCRALGEDTAAVALSLGDLASARGDVATAQREWLRSIRLGGVTAHRRLALWHEARGEFDQAAAQWNALGTRDGQAQEHLGMLALRQLDFASAQRYFLAARLLPGFYGQEAVDAEYVQLAALGENSLNGATAVGVAFVNGGLPLFARGPLERAVTETPEDASAHAYLAWVELLAGQQDAASTQVSQALALAPADPFARFVAASQEGARGEWAAAAQDCDIGLQHDDKNPALWLLLARAQEGQRAYLDAELSYENAAGLATEPQYTEQLLEFYVGHRLGLTDGRAYAAAVQAEARWPDSAAIRKLEGQIADLIGQPTSAYVAWTAALQLDPRDPEPWFVLGRYAYVGGDLTTAVIYLRTAAALQPGSEWAAQARTLLAPLPGAAI